MLPLPTSPIKRIFFSSHLSPNFYGPASRGGTLFGRYLKWRWVLSALPGNRESILCTVKCIKNHHRLFLSSSSSQFMLQSSRIFFKLWTMLFLSRYIAIASHRRLQILILDEACYYYDYQFLLATGASLGPPVVWRIMQGLLISFARMLNTPMWGLARRAGLALGDGTLHCDCDQH